MTPSWATFADIIIGRSPAFSTQQRRTASQVTLRPALRLCLMAMLLIACKRGGSCSRSGTADSPPDSGASSRTPHPQTRPPDDEGSKDAPGVCDAVLERLKLVAQYRDRPADVNASKAMNCSQSNNPPGVCTRSGADQDGYFTVSFPEDGAGSHFYLQLSPELRGRLTCDSLGLVSETQQHEEHRGSVQCRPPATGPLAGFTTVVSSGCDCVHLAVFDSAFGSLDPNAGTLPSCEEAGCKRRTVLDEPVVCQRIRELIDPG